MEYNTSARGVNEQLKRQYETAEAMACRYCHDLLAKRKQSPLSLEDIEEAMEKVVRAKYFLEGETLASKHFHYLGELSLARMLGKDVSEIKGIDLEAKCNGTSTVMTKKILLFMFVNRELSINISAEEAADAVSLDDLSALVFHRLSKHDI